MFFIVGIFIIYKNIQLCLFQFFLDIFASGLGAMIPVTDDAAVFYIAIRNCCQLHLIHSARDLSARTHASLRLAAPTCHPLMVIFNSGILTLSVLSLEH